MVDTHTLYRSSSSCFGNLGEFEDIVHLTVLVKGGTLFPALANLEGYLAQWPKMKMVQPQTDCHRNQKTVSRRTKAQAAGGKSWRLYKSEKDKNPLFGCLPVL